MRSPLLLSLLLIASPALADDARKLAEDGWSAYQKHDLDKAEKLTRQAIAATVDIRVKAAALYNLGRVLEERKDRAGAIQAYKDSFDARHSGVVRDRLRTLDAAAADALDWLKPTKLKGPFASLDAWCTQQAASEPAASRNDLIASCKGAALVAGKVPALPAPIQALELRSIGEGATLILEVKVGGAWFVDELKPYEDSGHCSVTATKLDGVTAHGAVLEVAYRYDGSCNSRDGAWTYREKSIAIVGVGASKVPASPPTFVAEMTETAGGKKTMDWQRKLTWNRDGSIDVAIARATGGTMEASMDDTEDVRGHHALAFP